MTNIWILTLSTVGRTLWEELGVCLLEEVCHWEVGFEVSKGMNHSHWALVALWLCVKVWFHSYSLSAMTGCLLPCSCCDGCKIQPSESVSFKLMFSFMVLCDLPQVKMKWNNALFNYFHHGRVCDCVLLYEFMHTCEYRRPQKPEKDFRSLGAQVTGVCQLP